MSGSMWFGGVVGVLAISGCADEGPPGSGSVIFGAEEGVDFDTGKVVSEANARNCDLYAARNGTWLKLLSGGATVTEPRQLQWFIGGGGVPQAFASLAEVRATELEGASGYVGNAKPRLGFVVETASGDYVRGWIASGSAEAVSIEWERVAE